ncbi:hypothetical protein BIFDEN_00916 [Bifidobacterium dentium ATCC 27678]|nr:hypothetical protein BIFDEN_00916 [Bifidobacterium dentium ATCC 27678]
MVGSVMIAPLKGLAHHMPLSAALQLLRIWCASYVSCSHRLT